MKITYVAHYNIKDTLSGNGTDYFKARALEDVGCKVDYIFPLETKNSFLSRIERKILSPTQKYYFSSLNTTALKKYAAQISEKCSDINTDIIVCPTFHTISYLKINKPIVFWTDATLQNLVSLYPNYKNISWYLLSQGHRAQRLALKNASLAIYSNNWAAKSAIFDYHTPATKVKVVPFGINFSEETSHMTIEASILQKSKNAVCELLFVGFDVVRKGLDKAIEVTKLLNHCGMPTRLTIVGGDPMIPKDAERYVRVLGKLDKLGGSEEKLKSLFLGANFLILPTLADCTPMVISEAFSFGCPAISTDVGGISSMILTDVNGKCFSLKATAEDYSTYIKSAWQDKELYMKTCFAAYQAYKDFFDWKTSGTKVKKILEELLESSTKISS